MKYRKKVLLCLVFVVFFISSCDIDTTDSNNQNDPTTEDYDPLKDDFDDSNPDDGINWPSEIVWP